jgi:hypothetical protein
MFRHFVPPGTGFTSVRAVVDTTWHCGTDMRRYGKLAAPASRRAVPVLCQPPVLDRPIAFYSYPRQVGDREYPPFGPVKAKLRTASARLVSLAPVRSHSERLNWDRSWSANKAFEKGTEQNAYCKIPFLK